MKKSSTVKGIKLELKCMEGVCLCLSHNVIIINDVRIHDRGKKSILFEKKKRKISKKKKEKENLEIKSNKMLPLMPRKQNHIIMKSLFIPQCRQLKNVDSKYYCVRILELLLDQQIYLNQLLYIEFKMKIF